MLVDVIDVDPVVSVPPSPPQLPPAPPPWNLLVPMDYWTSQCCNTDSGRRLYELEQSPWAEAAAAMMETINGHFERNPEAKRRFEIARAKRLQAEQTEQTNDIPDITPYES